MQHTFLPNDIYLTVGKIIDQSLRFKSSINSLCYSSKFNNKKRLLALILKTLSFKIILDKLINDIPIVINTYRISRGVLYAVIYEHAFGKGHRNKFWRQLLQPFDKKIKAYIKAYMSEHKFTTKRSISKKMIKNPRFIRINTQKVSINDAIQNFISMGYKLVEMSFLNYTDFLKTEKALGKDEFIIDPLFKNLLSFHQSTDFHACAMAKNGQIILQDKVFAYLL
uniref:Putative 28S rRNA (Cytosine-C(5))-methyltransferase (Trinotate prediction) n=1 Tax=Henneguya salminicola TaxID=69463 RepID=A0A6G3MFW3_HENSL